MNNIINRDDLPKKKHGNKKVIDWNSLNNTKVNFNYKGIKGKLKVSFIKRVNGGSLLEVCYKDRKVQMYNGNFIKGRIGTLIGAFSKEHKYSIGEKVNNVIILEQTRQKDARDNNILSYKVRCVLTNKEFYQTQFNISYGYGSPYAAGHKVWEENWLYNEKHLIPLIKNIEDAKNNSIGSDNKILCICPRCKREKYLAARTLYKYGVTCQYCTPHLSYPERFMMSYLEVMNIRYVHQFKLGKNRRYIDFYLPDKNMAIEVHGEQHYSIQANSIWNESHEKTLKSDEFKRKYCKKNNIKLVEINARKSSFDFLVNSIENSILPDVSEDKMKEIQKSIIERKLNNDEFKILLEYKEGHSSNSIAKRYNVSVKHVTNIAKRHGVYINKDRHIKVLCKNTGVIYNSIAEASRATGINETSIGMVCSKKREYTKGKNNEKIYWKKIKNSNYNTVNDIV